MKIISVKVCQPKRLKRRNLKKFRLEFFQVSSFQPLRLKHLCCDDLHIIPSLSAVQIYEFHILMFMYERTCKKMLSIAYTNNFSMADLALEGQEAVSSLHHCS